MNIFSLKIFKDEGFRYATFYTVHQEDKTLSETDDFLETHRQELHHKEAFYQLIEFIKLIGEVKGAKPSYFRAENAAHALPPPPKTWKELNVSILAWDTPFRLYCLRLSDDLVILFNGGLKSSQKVQDSPQLQAKFRDANRWANAITAAIQNKDLRIHFDTVKKKHYLTNDIGENDIELFAK